MQDPRALPKRDVRALMRNLTKSAFGSACWLSLASLLVAPVAHAQSDQPGGTPRSDADAAARKASLREANSLSGSTGLLRTLSARSGAGGTFQTSVLWDWFHAKNVLCDADTPCRTTTGVASSDETGRIGLAIGLSAALTDFLEIHGALRSDATSNTRRQPEVFDTLGDGTLGLKLFTPEPVAKLWRGGVALQLLLPGGNQGVGWEPSATGLQLTALGAADIDSATAHHVPLQVTLNVGYLLDNGGEIAKGATLSRLDRFGAELNSVDQLPLRLGVEANFKYVRPFLEWGVNIPIDRQSVSCKSSALDAGDQCLKDASFSAWPSVLTAGARVYPGLAGLSISAAADVGTGGTSKFTAELAPTPPWLLWLGLGYGFDIQPAAPPPPKLVTVERKVEIAPPPETDVRGFIHEANTTNAVSNASVTWSGNAQGAIAVGADGHFVAARVPPGQYTFEVAAEGFSRGQCSAVVPAPGLAAAPGSAAANSPAPAAKTNVTLVEVDCALTPLPKSTLVSGQLIAVLDKRPIAGARLKLIDAEGHESSATSDANGMFRFENVDPGHSTLRVEADGYLPREQPLDVEPRHPEKLEMLLDAGKKAPGKAPAKPQQAAAPAPKLKLPSAGTPAPKPMPF
jgi:hypothetical protein